MCKLQSVFQRISLGLLVLFFSSAANSLTCADLNGATIYSQENIPTYLGFIGNQFASESINNSFGTYGSQFNTLSVRNTFSSYGGGFGIYSAENSFSSTPPRIYRNNILIAYLTTNSLIGGGISLSAIDTQCSFTASVKEDAPVALSNLTSESYYTQSILSWSASAGASGYNVYQCGDSSCSSPTFLGVASATSTTITSLQPSQTYYFAVQPYSSSGYGTSGYVSATTLSDSVPPVISLLGDSVVTHQINSTYTDAGATASDVVDGTIDVTTSGSVDVDTLGVYQIIYTAINNSGNQATEIRTVTVVSAVPIARQAIDSDKWFHQTRLPDGDGWYNNEIQHYTNRIENSYISDGTLKIAAIRENFTDQNRTKPFTSARLNSKYAFTYGRVEVKAKLPQGSGTWPAIWMLGKNITENGGYWQTQGFGTVGWPASGEIDIMEHWGRNQNNVSSALHTPSSYGGTVNTGSQYIATASSEFHVYSLDWNADRMIFSVDGNPHYTFAPNNKNADTWPFDSDQYLLLNFAIEPSIDSSFNEAELEVDYVRVYAPNASPSAEPVWRDEFNNVETNPDPMAVVWAPYDGTIIDGDTYAYPAGAQAWAGFSNDTVALYPFSFPNGGTLTFTGAIPAGGADVAVHFTFEANPYPNVNPFFVTDTVTVTGEAEATYTITLPAQGDQTFNSFLMYLETRDAGVIIKDVTVTASDETTDTGGTDGTDGGTSTDNAVNGVPTLTAVSILEDEGDAAVTIGDVVTVTISASEAILAPTVMIAGAVATPSGSGDSWTASRAMTADDSIGEISVSVAYVDISGYRHGDHRRHCSAV